MNVDLQTRMVALLGKPLGFSYAARMQNAAYRAAGINMLYFYAEVESHQLADVLAGVRHMNFAGVAVTKPNKVEVMQYMDEYDELCKKMGSSNTVVKLENGRYKAYNTDGMGFYIALQEETDIKLPETTFFCCGAGGTGRAICSTIAYHGARKIYITDKFNECSRALVEDINKNFAPVAEFLEFEDQKSILEKVAASGVVMNNSGVGMLPNLDATPLPKEALRKGQLCFDATYNPEKTRFLKEAEEVGCDIMNGLGMNIYQGAAQIELWSGQKAPLDAMRAEIAAILEEGRAKDKQ